MTRHYDTAERRTAFNSVTGCSGHFCIQATVGLILQTEVLAATSSLLATESIFILVEQTDGGWRRIKTRGCEGQFNFLQQEDELQPMGGRHLGFTSDLGFSTSYCIS